jgi:hypothetical protein
MLSKTGNAAFKLDDISEVRGVAVSLKAEFARKYSNYENLTYPSTFERYQIFRYFLFSKIAILQEPH